MATLIELFRTLDAARTLEAGEGGGLPSGLDRTQIAKTDDHQMKVITMEPET